MPTRIERLLDEITPLLGKAPDATKALTEQQDEPAPEATSPSEPPDLFSALVMTLFTAAMIGIGAEFIRDRDKLTEDAGPAWNAYYKIKRATKVGIAILMIVCSVIALVAIWLQYISYKFG